jgi:hypothetical protein
VAKAATQRVDLSRALASWRQDLAVMDLGSVAVRFIKSYAPLLAGIAAFVAPLGPRPVAKWLRRGLLMWNVARVVRRILLGW